MVENKREVHLVVGADGEAVARAMGASEEGGWAETTTNVSAVIMDVVEEEGHGHASVFSQRQLTTLECER